MATKQAPQSTQPRLKQLYKESLVVELKKELGLQNVNQVPRVQKIVVAVGIGKHKDDKRYHEIVVNTLRKITGQQPVDRMARKSIAGFKIRAGMNRIGVSVTLRGARMYEFMDRLVNVALPRVRDFHGVGAKGFDTSGNYTLGINDQSVFPELSFEDTQVIHGLQVTFVIRADEPAHSRLLLEKFGLPFEKTRKEDK
jgi:large subunit ribosomal protein L5